MARWLKSLLCGCALLWLPALQAATYTATVPIINGDLHQARREALRTVLLDAGQSGNIRISTTSTLVNMELAEAVRLQSSAALDRFKVIREDREGNLLTLTAEIDIRDKLPDCCSQPSVVLRNLAYQWLPPTEPLDQETEILLKLAMKQEIQKVLGASLIEDTPRNPADVAVYQLKIQLQGKVERFSSSLKLVVHFMGADGQLIQQADFPLTHTRITTSESQNIEGVSLVKKTPAPATLQRLADTAIAAAKSYNGLPLIVAVPPGRREWAIRPAKEISAEWLPTLVYCKTWPVKSKGLVDLIQMETFIRPKSVSSRQITFDLPSSEGGFILFQ